MYKGNNQIVMFGQMLFSLENLLLGTIGSHKKTKKLVNKNAKGQNDKLLLFLAYVDPENRVTMAI